MPTLNTKQKKTKKLSKLRGELIEKGLNLSGSESLKELKKLQIQYELKNQQVALEGNETLNQLKVLRWKKRLQDKGYAYTANKTRAHMALIDSLLEKGINLNGEEDLEELKQLKKSLKKGKKGTPKKEQIKSNNYSAWEELKAASGKKQYKEKAISPIFVETIDNYDILRKIVLTIKRSLDDLEESYMSSKSIAHRFIKKSAWWYSHPSGPVRAPKHADNIEGFGSNVKLKFGSNAIMVNKALNRFGKIIRRQLERATQRKKIRSLPAVSKQLRECMSHSVSNYDDEEYREYPIDEKGFMHFGAHAISTKDFISTYLEIVPLKKIISVRLRIK